MKFGFAFIPSMPYRQVVDLAQRAEDLGYDYVFLPDQTFHRDPFVLLGLCADVTGSITLGLAVTNPFTRHPVQIARAAGVLGEVAQGRFILGLGTGNQPRLLSGLGIDTSPAAERLGEAVHVIRALLAGDVVDYKSTWLTVNKVGLDYKPPYPVPIHIATRGRRILALAGEIADGVIMEGLFSPGALDFAMGRVREGANRAGRDFAQIEKTAWQSVTITDDPSRAGEERLRNWAALLIRTTQAPVLRAMGISTEVAAEVIEDAALHGEEGAGRRLTAADVRQLLMVGGPDEIREHARRLEQHGVDVMSVIVLGDHAQVRGTLERFATDVIRAA